MLVDGRHGGRAAAAANVHALLVESAMRSVHYLRSARGLRDAAARLIRGELPSDAVLFELKLMRAYATGLIVDVAATVAGRLRRLAGGRRATLSSQAVKWCVAVSRHLV